MRSHALSVSPQIGGLLRSSRFCILACTLVAVSAGIVVERALHLREVDAQVRTWRDINSTTGRVILALDDAETRLRGYLLTQQAPYLQAYGSARAGVPALTATLVQLSANADEVHLQARQLADLSAVKLAELAKTAELATHGDLAGAVATAKASEDAARMGAVRRLAETIQTRAESQTREARARVATEVQTLVISVVLTSAGSIALLILLNHFLRRDSRQIAEIAEQLSITVNSIGDAVVTTDEKGEITFLNPVAQKLAEPDHTDPDSAYPRLLNLLKGAKRSEIANPVSQVLDSGQTMNLAIDTALMRPDGTAVDIEGSASPLRAQDGAVRGVVFVFKDVTERRHAERELASAQQQLLVNLRSLEAAQEKLREADRYKDEFLAILAHELRNPLAPIRHAIRLLKNEGLDLERQRWARSVIERQVGNMARLLEDLVDTARIAQGQLTIKIAPVELAAVLEDALEIARPLIERKGHTLELAMGSEPLALMADRLRLAQVLANLLLNAAKYTDPGGRIALQVERISDGLRISISDSGVGMTADALSRIFRLFGQIDSSLDRAEGGLGVGLALAFELVKLHGGRLEARSEGLGRGSHFTITFPAAVVGRAAAKLGSDAVESATPSQLLMVVDDNVDAALALGMVLEASGHKPMVAYSGEDALPMARVHQPSAMIIDIGLPGIDGYAVARSIRAEPWGKRTLLIALTGWGQAADKEAATAAGFDHHVTKPADPDAIQQLIAARVGSRV